MQYIKINKINCTCFYLLKWRLENKIICGSHLGRAFYFYWTSCPRDYRLLLIDMLQQKASSSVSFHAIPGPIQDHPFAPRPIIPGEWWSHWPGISKQGQPTQGAFLRLLKEPSCGLSGQIEGRCWSEARPGQSVWSNLIRVLCSPSHRTQGSLWLPQDSGGLTHGLLGWWSLTPLGLGEHQNHSHVQMHSSEGTQRHTSECSQRLLWECLLVK